MIERWTITDRDEWLARRKPNINGSEIGALFGCNPYQTAFSLHVAKAGLAELSPPDSDVLQRGLILEPAGAAAAQQDHPEWKIEKATDYVWSPRWRLGCTPDYIIHCPQKGRGVLQVKTSDRRKFDEEWQDGPPSWIVLQTLQEMMLEEVSHGAIVVLILEFPFKVRWQVYPFERHPAAENRLKARAELFWADVHAGRQPSPDYGRDDEVIKALFPRDNGVTIDLTGDNRMPALLDEFEKLTAMGAHAEKQLKAVKAEIAAKLGDAAAATLPGWQVTNKTTTRKGYEVKATSYRTLRVKRDAQQEIAA
jgi:hypothetical protein